MIRVFFLIMLLLFVIGVGGGIRTDERALNRQRCKDAAATVLPEIDFSGNPELAIRLCGTIIQR